jgi:hypothetical protein
MELAMPLRVEAAQGIGTALYSAKGWDILHASIAEAPRKPRLIRNGPGPEEAIRQGAALRMRVSPPQKRA